MFISHFYGIKSIDFWNKKVVGCLTAEKSDFKNQENASVATNCQISKCDKLAKFEAMQLKLSEYAYFIVVQAHNKFGHV